MSDNLRKLVKFQIEAKLIWSMAVLGIDIVKVENIPPPPVKVVSDNISTPRTSSEFCLDSLRAFPFVKSPSNPKVFLF